MNLTKSKTILTLICVFVFGSAWAQDQQTANFHEVQSWIESYDQTKDAEVKGHLYGVEALNELMFKAFRVRFFQPVLPQASLYHCGRCLPQPIRQ